MESFSIVMCIEQGSVFNSQVFPEVVDKVGMSQESKNKGETMTQEQISSELRELAQKELNDRLEALIKTQKILTFGEGAEVEHEKVFGVLIAKYLGWNGVDVLEVAHSALIDSNFTGEAYQVEKILDQFQEFEEDYSEEEDQK